MSDIVFASSVFPDKAIIHDDEAFRVQWQAFNAGQDTSPVFLDRLVISFIANGCPGSDDQDFPVMFDSDTNGDPNDFIEQPLASGAQGSIMQPMVGPFAAGAYRLTVTLDREASNATTFTCIDIVTA